ncbi:MAG: endonuclease domain-containing protein [Candidatus Methanofastidiosia archaeon]
MGILIAQKSTRYGKTKVKAIGKQENCKLEMFCLYCKRNFSFPKTERRTRKYCSQKCAKLALKKPLIEKICEHCGKKFDFRSQGKRYNSKRRFCNQSCSAKWRMKQPEIRMQIYTEERTRKGKKSKEKWYKTKEGLCFRKEASKRMKKLNANPKFRKKMKKIHRSRRGKTWLGERGGNGFVTDPQLLLSKLLKLPMEYSIKTTKVKHLFQSLPNCYKVDLAIPKEKIAIEVDGGSHKLKKQRFLDHRKTEVLNLLGWKVIRFWNEDVMDNTEKVIRRIQEFTTLR